MIPLGSGPSKEGLRAQVHKLFTNTGLLDAPLVDCDTGVLGVLRAAQHLPGVYTNTYPRASTMHKALNNTKSDALADY